jgi:hypothetical protein
MSAKREKQSREFRHGMRGESAANAIGDLYKGCEIFGLTKGDFSMIDVLRHCLSHTGPADVTIGTWTAAHADVKQAERLLSDGRINSFRMLVDRSFPSRQPGYFKQVLQAFGKDAIRMARFHAKFLLIRNEEWDLCVRTSMNLNMNQRIENYEISDDVEMCGYMEQIVETHFAAGMQDSCNMFKTLDLEGGTPTKERTKAVKLGGWD